MFAKLTVNGPSSLDLPARSSMSLGQSSRAAFYPQGVERIGRRDVYGQKSTVAAWRHDPPAATRPCDRRRARHHRSGSPTQRIGDVDAHRAMRQPPSLSMSPTATKPSELLPWQDGGRFRTSRSAKLSSTETAVPAHIRRRAAYWQGPARILLTNMPRPSGWPMATVSSRQRRREFALPLRKSCPYPVGCTESPRPEKLLNASPRRTTWISPRTRTPSMTMRRRTRR